VDLLVRYARVRDRLLRRGGRRQVLLQLKNRPRWQCGKLNLPGGKIEAVDQGEPLAAASGELREETGFIRSPGELR
jgi:ADP-ribose pyrophosphatase YjhB (NUDIX family)